MRKRATALGTALLLISLFGCAVPTPSPQPQIVATPLTLRLISDPKVKEAERASFMIRAKRPRGIRDGTGVWMGQGLILTAFHLVGDPATGKIVAEEIQVSQPHLGWEEGCLAKVASADSSLDLVVLKCEKIEGLPAPSFGDPDQLLPGDTIYAVGHEFFPPRGIGILYPRDGRVSENLDTFFVIFPPFIRGFSGGGVFNLNHELVGIALHGFAIVETVEGEMVIKQGTIVRKIDLAFPLLEEAR